MLTSRNGMKEEKQIKTGNMTKQFFNKFEHNKTWFLQSCFSVLSKNLKLVSFAILIFPSSLSLISFSVKAQDVKIDLSVDETTVRVNDLIGVNISVTGGGMNNMPSAILDAPDGIKEMTGSSSTSQSISIINGVTSVTASEKRTFMATKVGDFTIGPAKVTFKGKNYVSNKITVKVIAAGKKIPSDSPNSGIDDYVFIRAIPAKTSIVVGEPVYVKYRLYFKTRIANVKFVQDVTTTGALTDDFDTKTPSTRPVEEVYKGVNYNAITLREIIVYPQQSGEVILNPVVMNVQAARPKSSGRRSIFDDFLIDPFQEYATVNISSPTVKLSVKSISPSPSNFSGFVGELKGKIDVSKLEANINEPVTVKLSFTGTGNFKNLIIPKLNFPSSVESYPPKEESQIKNSINGGTGKYSIEYVVIPRYSGDVVLPKMDIAYYDLSSKNYQTISLPEQKISVKGGTAQSAGNAGSNQAYDFRTIGRDISFIHTNTELSETAENPISKVYLGMIFCMIGWIGLFGFMFYRQRSDAAKSDKISYAHKNAEKFAKRALQNATSLSQNADIKLVLGEIHKVISQFVSHKTKLNETVWTVEELLNILKQKNIPDESLQTISTFLNRLNEFRFAPVQMIEIGAETAITEAEKALTELSKYL